jgi:hypothetical protein
MGVGGREPVRLLGVGLPRRIIRLTRSLSTRGRRESMIVIDLLTLDLGCLGELWLEGWGLEKSVRVWEDDIQQQN